MPPTQPRPQKLNDTQKETLKNLKSVKSEPIRHLIAFVFSIFQTIGVAAPATTDCHERTVEIDWEFFVSVKKSRRSIGPIYTLMNCCKRFVWSIVSFQVCDLSLSIRHTFFCAFVFVFASGTRTWFNNVMFPIRTFAILHCGQIGCDDTSAATWFDDDVCHMNLIFIFLLEHFEHVSERNRLQIALDAGLSPC